MERMNLRQAAASCSRSITTLRRYIRSGRLHAEKREGRFGPEYFVTADDLTSAGLETGADSKPKALATRHGAEPGSELPMPGVVPMVLYQELQMKHEQLLVQYGMLRAGGLQALGRQNEVESGQKQLEALRTENSRLRRQLQEANLELEGKSLEVEALLEKVRSLEMLSRNAVTNETIEKQFSQVIDQSRKVDELASRTEWRPSRRHRPPEH